MPANDFEKQAKQLLDEITFRPNDEVWLQVEKRIREKKRRRWIIILPLFLALMLGGYFMANKYSIGNKEKIIAADKDKAKTNLVTPVQNNTVTKNEKAIAGSVNNDLKNIEKATTLVENENQLVTKSSVRYKLPVTPYKKINKNNAAANNPTVLYNGDDIISKGNLTTENSTVNPVLIPIKTDDAISKQNNLNKPGKEENKLTEKAIDNIVKTEIKLPVNSVNKKAIVKKQNKPGTNWKFGITFSAGLSNVQENLLGLSLNTTKAAYSANTATGGQQLRQPSANYKDFAYRAGFFLQRKISKRSNFSFGLNYALYQTRINVGAKIDSLIPVANATGVFYDATRSGISVTGQQNKYHSKLHYVELPVLFTTQINKSSKLPVYWVGGFSIGKLIASNYLHYDTTASGIYYKDNSLLKKVAVNLQTGFGVTFFNSKAMPVTIAPTLQFGLTDFLKNSADKRYLLFGGTRIQLLLNNKKKK